MQDRSECQSGMNEMYVIVDLTEMNEYSEGRKRLRDAMLRRRLAL